MSTINETSKIIKAKKRSIREIPAVIKAGNRMSHNQLRFCVIAAVVLIAVLYLVMASLRQDSAWS